MNKTTPTPYVLLFLLLVLHIRNNIAKSILEIGKCCSEEVGTRPMGNAKAGQGFDLHVTCLYSPHTSSSL
jgi:hypothetical protein